jgi:hypothetical protein
MVVVLFFAAFDFIDFDFELVVWDSDFFEGWIWFGGKELNFFAFSFFNLLDFWLRSFVLIFIPWRVDSGRIRIRILIHSWRIRKLMFVHSWRKMILIFIVPGKI